MQVRSRSNPPTRRLKGNPSTSRRSRILSLALPIIGAMISQSIINLVDTAMVGSLGDTALAAVGVGGFATLMSVAVFMGFSSSVQAISSRRIGQGRAHQSAFPLNGALLLSLVAGVPAAAFLFWLAPHLLSGLATDKAVASLALPYYQIRVLAVVAVGMNLAFSGFWNGTDRPQIYMKTLWFMHASNIALNYLLIFGKFGFPELGVTGAAVGTTLSLYLGTLVFWVAGARHARGQGYLAKWPTLQGIRTLVRLLLPGGFQQFFFWGGMTLLTTIVGWIGTEELAVTSVLLQLVLTMILIQVGFGLAAATLAGQALGAENVEAAREWVRSVIRLSLTVTLPLTLMVVVQPELLLRPFIHNAQTLALAADPMRLIALTFAIDCFGVVYLNSLQGVGDQKMVMVILAGCQWVVFLPLAYLVGPLWGYGLAGVWGAHLFYRAVQAWLLHRRWQTDSWTAITI